MTDTISTIDKWLAEAGRGHDATGAPLHPGDQHSYIDALLDRRMALMSQRSGTATASKSPCGDAESTARP